MQGKTNTLPPAINRGGERPHPETDNKEILFAGIKCQDLIENKLNGNSLARGGRYIQNKNKNL